MRDLTIGIVAERPTDVNMIMELVDQIIPGDHRFLPLQPEISETEGFGAFGAGWKGVLSWCESIKGSFYEFLNQGNPIDLLIIHLDADVSREAEVNCYKPCPPAEETVLGLQRKVMESLGLKEVDKRILFCIPSDNTEAWILCAFDSGCMYHNPPSQHLECLQKPDYIICQKPFNLLKMKEGKPKKTRSKYRDELIPQLLNDWGKVKESCFQAERFEQDLLEFVREI